MKELYHIVATDNGYTVMARDFNGDFYLARKENSTRNPDVLVFASRDEAQEYIDDWFHPDYCVSEPFWMKEEKSNIKPFERLQKIAKEEFGLTVIRSDKQETFKDLFGVEVDCDGRCMNCDYFDFISEDCTKGKEDVI